MENKESRNGEVRQDRGTWSSVELYAGCVSGAIEKGEHAKLLRETGFENVKVVEEIAFQAIFSTIDSQKIRPEEAKGAMRSLLSVTICGMKPRAK
ncbi:MAG: hypothetical protein JTT11_04725 [Candidatus Brockarchaeota archaeon]|nr:hypothetical protein [Candidatus Brockarchaeota archaeon]